MADKKTNSTIEYIDEKRLLNGLPPRIRGSLLTSFKSPKELSDKLGECESEKDLMNFYLQVCDNGTAEDIEMLDKALDFEFSNAKYYRALVEVCLEEKYITTDDVIYEEH